MDDYAERLARVEARQEQLLRDSDRLENARQSQNERTTKMESKVGVIWAALGGLATMVGAFMFNYFSKGGNP